MNCLRLAKRHAYILRACRTLYISVAAIIFPYQNLLEREIEHGMYSHTSTVMGDDNHNCD